ncbi:uncharacterized protein LOC143210899 [Lasioglossum baleicum]|uniref:uncharacterized protein LOC143210899 n=1 Tax=Lasioglossum baleicum TaxID=434251 RepID=UPI003FCE19DB
MGFTMFLICGKGGYDVEIFQAPWRIVVPATILNVIFVLITTYSVTNLEKGYLMFSQNLKSIYIQMNITRETPKPISQCEIVQEYLQYQSNYEYDLCKLFPWLQVLSYIMMWSWLGGLMILIFRIITINDFKLLRIRIYDVSNDLLLNKTNRNGPEDNNITNKEKIE